MIHFYCIALLVLCGQVELFKLGLLSGPVQVEQQAEVYQPALSKQQQIYPYGYQQQQQIYPGRPQPLPYQPYQPPAVAYVIVRPITPNYPYYDSSVRYWAPLHQQQQQAHDLSGVKGGELLQQAPILPTKGGLAGQEQIKQEKLEELPEQQVAAPQQSEQVYDLGLGKLLKLKSSLDKFAASAKSKLSLGTSSYYVTGEEIVPQAAPPQPLQQEQIQTSELQMTKLEQQRIEDVGQTKLLDSQQQQLEDTRATKTLVEENTSRGTKLEETRQTTKLEETPQVLSQQVKLEDTRQEKLIEQQEPLREQKETKGLSEQQQLPLQQERYAEPRGQQQLQQKPQRELIHQQREQQEQLEQGSLKAAAELPKDRVRFSGPQQQPSSYISGQVDADGFGKRVSAL